MLRDDVQSLFTKIREKKSEILSIIKELLVREHENRHFLDTGKIDLLENNLTEMQALFEEIDSKKYDLSRLIDQTAETTGFARDKIEGLMGSREEKIFHEISLLDNEMRNVSKSLVSERERLIRSMEARSISLKKEIRELGDMDRIIRNTPLLNTRDKYTA